MPDIANREDLSLLMKEFYSSMLEDKQISYIFTEVSRIDLEKHLPILVNFWDQVLFNHGDYKSNVLQIHLDLNKKEPLTAEHFKIWLHHFQSTVDKNFSGTNAEIIKTRALSVATVMQIKIAAS
jgi:hemoglobin